MTAKTFLFLLTISDWVVIMLLYAVICSLLYIWWIWSTITTNIAPCTVTSDSCMCTMDKHDSGMHFVLLEHKRDSSFMHPYSIPFLVVLYARFDRPTRSHILTLKKYVLHTWDNLLSSIGIFSTSAKPHSLGLVDIIDRSVATWWRRGGKYVPPSSSQTRRKCSSTPLSSWSMHLFIPFVQKCLLGGKPLIVMNFQVSLTQARSSPGRSWVSLQIHRVRILYVTNYGSSIAFGILQSTEHRVTTGPYRYLRAVSKLTSLLPTHTPIYSCKTPGRRKRW